MGLDWIIGVEKYALGVETERGVRGCSYRRGMDVVGYEAFSLLGGRGRENIQALRFTFLNLPNLYLFLCGQTVANSSLLFRRQGFFE